MFSSRSGRNSGVTVVYRGYDEAALHTIPDSAVKDLATGDSPGDGINSSDFSDEYRYLGSMRSHGKRIVSITPDSDIHEEVTDLILIVHGIGQGVCTSSPLTRYSR